jgi:hypothetical protein
MTKNNRVRVRCFAIAALVAGAACAENWVFNGSFANNVAGWPAEAVVMWTDNDAGGSPWSGSAKLVNVYPIGANGQGIDQCLAGPPIVPGAAYDYGGRVSIPTDQVQSGYVGLGLRWYPGPGCSGSPIDQPRASRYTATNGFVDVQELGTIAPDGAASVEFVAYVTRWENGGSYYAFVDNLFFGPSGAAAGIPATYVSNAAHVTGYGGVPWRTDLEVHNPTNHGITFTVEPLLRNQANAAPAGAVVPRSHPSAAPPQVSFSVAAGASRNLPDILANQFGITGTAAALRIRPDSDALVVSSRTYNDAPGGTFGQFVGGEAESSAIGYGQQARLVQLRQDLTTTSGFRTNIGFVNTVNMQISIQVDLYDAGGVLLGTLTYPLQPYEYQQIDKIFLGVTANAVAEGYVVLRTTTPAGRFLAYASLIDSATGDPMCIPARPLH